MSLDEIRNVRLQKLSKLREVFGSAFPMHADRTHTVADVIGNFSKLKKRKQDIKIAGRVRSIRGHGGSAFIDLEEGETIAQCYLKKDKLGNKRYELFLETIDIGDFVGVSGSVFATKKREKTLRVSNWWPLAKSLRPLPEKWHGIQDTEERFRKRSLDLLMNRGTRERFRARRVIIRALRDFLLAEAFEEVETPILQPLYGGALAHPFTTHYNALDADFYLRIAPELYLKRLIVGNLPRVFEIGKNFRNEGIDVSHSPEFTELEGYMSYGDMESLKALIEKLMFTAAKEVLKKTSFIYEGKSITLKKPFRSITFTEAIKRYALLPRVGEMSNDDLLLTAKQLGIEVGRVPSRGKLLDEIFKKSVRKHLIQPIFVTHHPIDISPLAKASDQEHGTAERLQLIIGGVEVINAYSELNDPLEQRERFLAQEAMLKKGDEEVSRLDEDYLEIMEYGMPPVAGFGVGIDRLVQLFTDTHNVREVILFPTLKPRK